MLLSARSRISKLLDLSCLFVSGIIFWLLPACKCPSPYFKFSSVQRDFTSVSCQHVSVTLSNTRLPTCELCAYQWLKQFSLYLYRNGFQSFQFIWSYCDCACVLGCAWVDFFFANLYVNANYLNSSVQVFRVIFIPLHAKNLTKAIKH